MTTVFRWIFVFLAVYILIKSIHSLLSSRVTPEVWGYLYIENGIGMPIYHFENVIGRAKSADLKIELNTLSKNHGILSRKGDGQWIYKDLNSKNGSKINGVSIKPETRYLVNTGDEIEIGLVKCRLAAISMEEVRNNEELRNLDKSPMSPWKSMVAVTIFQILTIIQLIIGMGDKITPSALSAIPILGIVMWIYVITFWSMGRKGFEMEIIAFFMSTISLAITASSAPELTIKQLISMIVGLFLFIFMCIFIRNLNRTKKIRPLLAGLSVLLLLFNLIFGTVKNGAANWVSIGGMSFQPSELVKLAFICIGAATLEELFQRKNLMLYALFSLFCLGCLALMSDFGMALIFFVTFVVVSFLRSGDFSRLLLTVVGAAILGMMALRFKPYIADRFGAWGHVWDFADTTGYQQTRTMAYGAGGGLLGLGAGNGSLKTVGASNTDLVFGMVMEEWGFVIAFLLVICIITFTLFAVNSIVAGRSTFFTIAACGAATMFIFQTTLNVFGAVDLFPLTGVTFPFVSTGGTSMVTSWAMLAYFKASDMRQNASLAIKGAKNA